MGAGARTAARMWARVEVGRRWKALVALGVLAGVTAGLALASVAGARRTDTAWPRLRESTRAADAIVFTSQSGIVEPDELDYDTFADLPYVTAIGAFGVMYGQSEEVGEFGGFLSTYGDWLVGVDAPRIIEGRRPSPDAPYEVVLSKPDRGGDAAELGVGVGSEMTVSLLTREQASAGRYDAPEGPTVTFTVVGIGDSPFDIAAIPSTGDLFIGPAFRERHGTAAAMFSNLTVRVADPDRDIRRLEAEVARKYPGRSVPVYDLNAAGKRVTNATTFERSGLLLFGGAVALAGILIVGQALTRSVRAAGGDVPTLVALGFSNADAMRALAMSHLPAVAVSAVVAVATAVALSPRFPIGLGRRVEIDRGIHVDLPVLLAGLAALVLLLGFSIAVTAWRATREVDISDPRLSSVVGALRSAGAPVVVSTGASLALDPGHSGRSLPTRPAVMGAIVGVLGVLAAATLSAGIEDAIGHPERFGSVWDAEASFSGTGPAESALTMPDDISGADDVEHAARFARVALPVRDVVLPIYALDQLKGSIDFVILDGRGPARPGEIVLGPDSARVLGVDLGDTVPVGEAGALTVVGLGLMPTTAHSSFDQGGWLLPRDLLAAIGGTRRAAMREELASYGLDVDVPDAELPYLYGGVLARFAEGTDVEAGIGRLRESVGEGVVVETASEPADQQNLGNVRRLPLLFAVFATALAVAALAHVSASVLRRRRGDLAVLRSLGFTPRQARACLAWQATTLALVGVAVGVPAGVAAGRLAWRSAAEATPMVYIAPVALAAILLSVPVALLAANTLAAWPGHRAARLQPAEVLRAE